MKPEYGEFPRVVKEHMYIHIYNVSSTWEQTFCRINYDLTIKFPLRWSVHVYLIRKC